MNPYQRAASFLMRGLAAFAFVWAVVRAHLQAITGDEGENYVVFVAPHFNQIWNFSATNHLLNTLLMRLSTAVLGPAPLALRIPALIGAALYISAAYWLCRLITERWEVRLPLFVCLVYNPFVFDYLVAARGYGLASGLLLFAIALHLWAHSQDDERRDRVILPVCALASVSLVLSFTANFSFAFVDAAAGAGLLVWALMDTGQHWRRIALWRIVPALATLVVLPGWTLLHAERGQLFWGAETVREMFRSLRVSSFYKLNDELANPLVLRALETLQPYLLRGLLIASAVALALHLYKRQRDAGTRRLLALLAIAGGSVLVSFGIHWTAHVLIRMPLPLERTGLYMVVLTTLCFGIIAALPAQSRSARIVRTVLLAALCATAVYDLFCLRLNHFREWAYQQDVDEVYHRVAWYARNRGVKDIEVSWYYYGALSYYRLAFDDTRTIPSFAKHDSNSGGKQLYVLNGAFDKDFIEAQKLNVAWRSLRTEVVIALRE